LPAKLFVPILTREQARFIIWCLAYDRMQRKANGFKNHRYGLLTKLGKKFGVSRECIVQINKRRTWRSINWPETKAAGRPAKHPGYVDRDLLTTAAAQEWLEVRNASTEATRASERSRANCLSPLPR
jgi:hypothetical protein